MIPAGAHGATGDCADTSAGADVTASDGAGAAAGAGVRAKSDADSLTALTRRRASAAVAVANSSARTSSRFVVARAAEDKGGMAVQLQYTSIGRRRSYRVAVPDMSISRASGAGCATVTGDEAPSDPPSSSDSSSPLAGSSVCCACPFLRCMTRTSPIAAVYSWTARPRHWQYATTQVAASAVVHESDAEVKAEAAEAEADAEAEAEAGSRPDKIRTASSRNV